MPAGMGYPGGGPEQMAPPQQQGPAEGAPPQGGGQNPQQDQAMLQAVQELEGQLLQRVGPEGLMQVLEAVLQAVMQEEGGQGQGQPQGAPQGGPALPPSAPVPGGAAFGPSME